MTESSECGRKYLWPILRYYFASSWRLSGKPWKLFFRIHSAVGTFNITPVILFGTTLYLCHFWYLVSSHITAFWHTTLFPEDKRKPQTRPCTLYSDLLHKPVRNVTVMPMHLISCKKVIDIFKCHNMHKLLLYRMTNTVRLYVYLLTSANIPVFSGVCLEM